MPLVRIDLVQGKSAEYRRAIGGVVYEAMVDVLKAPKDDRFQVITEYPADALIADENYLGIRRTQDCVFIRPALNIGRTVVQRKGFLQGCSARSPYAIGASPRGRIYQSHRGSKRELVLPARDRPIRGVAGQLVAPMISPEALKWTPCNAT